MDEKWELLKTTFTENETEMVPANLWGNLKTLSGVGPLH